MAVSFASGVFTITSGTETFATLFADVNNAAVGDNGTYIDRKPSSRGSTFYNYTLKNCRIGIDFTASFNALENFCFIGNSATWHPYFTVRGVLVAGGSQELFGYTYESKAPLLGEFKQDTLVTANAFNAGCAAIRVENGGIVQIIGCELHHKEGILITNKVNDTPTYSDGSITIANSKLVTHGTNSSLNSNIVFGGVPNATLEDVEYLTSTGMAGEINLAAITNATSLNFSRLKIRHTRRGIKLSSAISFPPFRELDLEGNENGAWVNTTTTGLVARFVDGPLGNALPIYYGPTTTTKRGSVEIAVVATLSSSLDFSYRLVDANNGSRNGAAYTSDRVYSGSLSGGVASAELLTGVQNKTADPIPTFDVRLPIEGLARRYGFLQYGIEVTDSDAKPAIPIPATADANITELNKATVDAYPGFAFGASSLSLSADVTNAQIYDRIRSYLADNLAIARFGEFTKAANRLTIDVNLTLSVALSAGGVITFAGTTLDLTTTATQSRAFEIGGSSIVTVPDGPVDLSAWEFALGSQINLRAGATAASVTIAAGQGDNITAGAGVTLVEPVDSVEITNIPAVAGAIVGVRDLTTLEETFPTITGTTTSFPSNPARSYLVCIDAPGYQLQRVTLSGATPSFEANLENNRALYESGVNISANLLFDYPTMGVTFVFAEGVVFNNANIYRTLEDYLATPSGVFFANPPRPVQVPGRNFLLFPYDDIANTVNPVVVRPDPANTGDPRITDVVVILEGATNPQTDIFDFSAANGRVIYYQTDSTVANVNVSSGLSPEDRTVIDAIKAKTDPLTFSVANQVDANALSGGGSGGGISLVELQGELATVKGLGFDPDRDSLLRISRDTTKRIIRRASD